MTTLQRTPIHPRPWRRLASAVVATVVSFGGAGASAAAEQGELKLLLVDDHHVMYGAGTHRIFHPATPHPANPVIAEDKPWEVTIAWNSVYRNPKTGKHQMWYQAYAGKTAKEKAYECTVAYAESDDGVTWTKPKLGLFPFNDVPAAETNIVLIGSGGYGDRYACSVVVDERESDPSKRYKMLYYDWETGPGEAGWPGAFAAFSPDGIKWTKAPEGLLYRTHYGAHKAQPPMAGTTGYFETPGKAGQVRRHFPVPLSMSDAVDVFWDPNVGKFVGYGKCWISGPDGGLTYKHAMARTESDDFLRWSHPVVVSQPDDDDPAALEFHTSPVFLHDGVYFCINQLLGPREETWDRTKFFISTELMISRDGFRWKRPFRGQPFLDPAVPQTFSQGSIFTNGTPVMVGDEMRFYYGGYSATAIGGGVTITSPEQKSGVGFAAIKRDRFAGIRPVPLSDQVTLKKPLENVGQITMKPIDLTGRRELRVNADASKGALRIELLDEAGYRLKGYTADDADPLKADALDHVATWKSGKTIADLKPGRYQIRVHLDHAEVFAFTVK